MAGALQELPAKARRAGPPDLLFFSEESVVARVMRAQLPEGWRMRCLQDRHDEQEKLRELAGADVLIHTDTPVTRAHVEAAPHLALVQRQGVGVDAVDLDALREHGVALAICPLGTAEAVAEHTVMLAMAAGRHLPRLHDGVTQGGWPRWDYRDRSLSLSGATVGVVGFGRIGQAVAHRVLAFGSRVLVHRGHDRPLEEQWAGRDVERCPDLDTLFARSDVVTLHCPLVPATRGLVDGRRLALMGTDAVLVNTARGELVVQPDLVAALRAGRPAAAGLDVFATEPPAADDPLLALPNVVLTPHSGAGTRQTQLVKARGVVANVARLWAGQPVQDRVL